MSDLNYELPHASQLNIGGLNYWIPGIGNTTNLIKELTNPNISFSSAISGSFANAVVSFKQFPFNIDTVVDPGYLTTENLTIGGVNDFVTYVEEQHRATYQKKVLLNNVKRFTNGSVAPSSFVFNMGQQKISKYFNSFLDFEGYTTIKLWLPYIDYVDLPVNQVMNKYINIDYVVDMLSGEVEAFVSVSESTNGDKKLLFTRVGQMGLDIPLSTSNASDIQRKNMEMGISMGASVLGSVASLALAPATGGLSLVGLGASIGGLGSTINSAINNNIKEYNVSNVSRTFAMWYAPQKCHLIFQRPEAKTNNNYVNLKGLPCETLVDMDDFQSGDFVQVDSVHMEGFEYAMQNEIDEIERILKEGIII